MRKILVIGIGAGDPEQLTMQAVRALNEADVFFLLDKGHAKRDLIALREEILRCHVRRPGYRVVEDADPERDRTTPTADRSGAYTRGVDDWRRARADIYERLIRDELADGECGAFLVWGDPALYDSTLGILDDVLARGTVAFEHTVIPGISSVSALAARHRTGLNRVGRPVQITTGRRLAEAFPEDADDVVVMLDAHRTYERYADEEDLYVYWGAYLGTPDEILASGPLAGTAERITALREEARERKGWIMDTYLLRRLPRQDPQPPPDA
ncbi:precorrin-6A synthase (deacetylating) [Streptomyces sp. TRM 70351]|uniref:precorrin-6A synthase (deacetylating) n=1 Tax=Streptomyces sp. TRM 70351 TaxID=3116552 RepID=UPI002E7B9FE8|nr:precorrin-6A synthase (deacetylating) [Streptomyces sp. TRM 70351]MEE1930052.1 precorrin-6A synthase (deacetylating) [Streptomyces sp. TRM 70351]